MSDSERLVREVSFAVEGDGRTIEARIVPYNTPTEVVDLPEHGGTGVPYVERWLPGAFEKQASAANRVKVWLNIEHEDGFRAVVGHGVALRESPDALYGTFRVEPGVDGDKALHMVNEGILTGLSIEAIPTRTRRTVDGIVERVKARLDKVSLVRDGLAAYESARVLAVREAPPEEITAPPEVTEPAPAPEPVAPQTPPAPVAPTYVFNFGSNFTPEVLTQASVTASPPPAQVEATEPAAAPAETPAARMGNPAVNEVLERVGYQPLVKRAAVDAPWDGSPSRFTDEEYERSALICRPGDDPPKQRCSLPVREPNGTVNKRALGAAAGRLNQLTDISPEMRAAAARKLVRLYRASDMEPPPALLVIAGR